MWGGGSIVGQEGLELEVTGCIYEERQGQKERKGRQFRRGEEWGGRRIQTGGEEGERENSKASMSVKIQGLVTINGINKQKIGSREADQGKG